MMIKRGSIVLAIVGAAITCPQPCEAYCVQTSFALLWSSGFPDLQIPVYLSTGAKSTIVNAGLTVDEAERFVLEIIRRHNESSVGPIFFYAGVTNTDMDFEANTVPDQFVSRPLGVTFDSYTCEEPAVLNLEICPEKARACADNGQSVAKVRLSIVPAGCNNGEGVPEHSLSSNDTAYAALHEFGHALGLLHSNRSMVVCDPSPNSGKQFGGNVNGNDSVMRATLGGNFPAFREWRRDDIAGLSTIYMASPTKEIAYWDDRAFPASPSNADLTSLVGQAATRPPALSSAPSSNANPIYLVTTDTSKQVLLFQDDGGGFVGPEIVENGAAGQSWGNVAVAAGEDHVLVLWSSGEQHDDAKTTHRWGIKDLQTQGWTYAEAPDPAVAKRLGAGYAGSEIFVLSALADFSSTPSLMTVDASSGALIERVEVTGLEAFDIGSGACFEELGASYCAIPYSVNSLDGIDLAWLDVEVSPLGTITVLDLTPSSVPAWGKVSLASRPDMSEFRGGGGEQRYELPQAPGVGASNSPDPQMLPVVDAIGWPVVMGSLVPLNDPTRWVGAVRREVECGNEIVQGGEECDDGNLMLGDGCDDQCMSEMDETGTGGPDSDLPPEGCVCSSRGEGGAGGSVLGLLALFWWSRRARAYGQAR